MLFIILSSLSDSELKEGEEEEEGGPLPFLEILFTQSRLLPSSARILINETSGVSSVLDQEDPGMLFNHFKLNHLTVIIYGHSNTHHILVAKIINISLKCKMLNVV